MKTKFRNFYRTLASALMPLLGFTACGNDDPYNYLCLYGTPTSDYHVKGTVTDENGTPIKGIKVVMHEMNGSYDYRADSTFTDADGCFTSKELDAIGDLDNNNAKKSLKVSLEDIDGEANGGTFATDTIHGDEMNVTRTKKGDGNWNRGSFELSATKKMKKKQ